MILWNKIGILLNVGGTRGIRIQKSVSCPTFERRDKTNASPYLDLAFRSTSGRRISSMIYEWREEEEKKKKKEKRHVEKMCPAYVGGREMALPRNFMDDLSSHRSR